MTVAEMTVVEMVRPSTRRRVMQWGALAGILILAAALRWPGMGQRSLWFDECCSVQCATGRGLANRLMGESSGWLTVGASPDLTKVDPAIPWTRIFTSLGSESHPPLYFVLLRFWMAGFGNSEFSMRLLSLLIFLPAIVLLWDSVRRLNGAGPALWAALLLAVGHILIWESGEVRNYALMLTLCLLAVNLLVRTEKDGANLPRIALLGVVSLAAVMTHYYSVLFLTGLAIYALIRLRSNTRAVTLAAFIGAAVIFLAVWGSRFHEQQAFVSRNLSWTHRHCPSLGSLVYQTARAGVLAPMQYLVNPNTEMPKAAALLALTILLSLVLLRKRKDLLLWQVLLLTPLLAAGVIDLVGNTGYLGSAKYTLPAAAALCALLSVALWHQRGWIRHIVPAGITILCLATIAQSRVPRTDWRTFAGELCRTAQQGDALVVASRGDPARWGGGDMYLPLSRYGRNLQAKVLVLGDCRPMSDENARALERFHAVWAITNDDYVAPPIIPGWRLQLVRTYPFTAALWRAIPVPTREYVAP